MMIDQQRHCAVKICIQEILERELVAEPEQGVFLRGEQGITIHRVNVVGTILYQETIGTITNVLLDDGTEKIIVRFFEPVPILNSLEVGSPIIVIGKVREYNQERYVSPEIAKLISPLWLKARSLELRSRKERMTTHQREEGTTLSSVNQGQKITIEAIEVESIFSGKEIYKQQEKGAEGEGQKEDDGSQRREEEPIDEEEVISGGLPFDRILGVIQELDQGDGAMIEEVIEKSPIKETETLLQKMLEKGDIFQIVPGKVKVL